MDACGARESTEEQAVEFSSLKSAENARARVQAHTRVRERASGWGSCVQETVRS